MTLAWFSSSLRMVSSSPGGLEEPVLASKQDE